MCPAACWFMLCLQLADACSCQFMSCCGPSTQTCCWFMLWSICAVAKSSLSATHILIHRSSAASKPTCVPSLQVRTGKLKPRALRHLAAEQLGLAIQVGEHSPVDDARAALYIYLKHRKVDYSCIGRPVILV
jgi:hypothetical protein